MVSESTAFVTLPRHSGRSRSRLFLSATSAIMRLPGLQCRADVAEAFSPSLSHPLSRRNGGRPSPHHGLLLGVLCALAGSPALAQTLPTDGVFVRGDGQISQTAPGAVAITQSTDRGVIDWRAFSIATGNQVSINNGAGATLNRVLGGQLSQIDGLLTATGSVYLMNPNGVIVGSGGRILSGGNLVVSTRAMNPDAFMAGGPLAASGTSNGAIVNDGQLTSQAGSVVMIARSVTNTGTIQASQGRVTLAAADDVLLTTNDAQGKDLFVSVAGGGGDVTQAGRIEAAAAALKAADGNIFTLAGNRDGLVQASGSATINGELWLTAPNGAVQVSSVLTATNADASGGKIVVNGKSVTLGGSARISTAGTKGGEVLVGTSEFGTGKNLAASATIADGATILAGGPSGGGSVETSGQTLSLGAANVSAGVGGRWLVDPSDIVIDATAAGTIASTLNGGTDVAQSTAAGSGGSGDISVNAPIVWAGVGNLTLTADRDLSVSQAITGGGGVTLIAGRDATLGATVSGTTVAATATGTLTLTSGGRATGSGNVVLTAGVFVNQRGADALASSGGTWRVYSAAPANDMVGGLTPDFYQYAAPAGATALGTGNGLFYSIAPTVGVTLGVVTKTYDGTTTALLDDGNTTVTGLINGDDWSLDGAYATKDAGTGLTVTAGNFLATHDGAPVYGYATPGVPATSTTSEITRAALTASIVNTPTKVYNAATTAQLVASNLTLTGVAVGETITVTGASTAAYDSANAGPRAVTATFGGTNFAAGGSTSLANYVLPTTASGAGLITQAPLSVLSVTANSKVYDGTTAATLNTGSATLFGVVGADDVTLSTASATGVFATRNVGNGIVVTGSGFAVSGGASANYQVIQPTGLAANITKATLQVLSVDVSDKVYDGTRAATVDTSSATFIGLVPGDDVEVTAGSFTFDSKDVGVSIPVHASNVQIGGADGGNYNLVAQTPFSADITPAPLIAAITGNPTKTYDGNDRAFITSSQYTLTGFVAGERAIITQVTDASYASKDAGSRTVTATLTPPDFLADAGTALSNYILPTLVMGPGTIDPAPLSITIVGNPTKAYDGNNSASLGPSNFEVDGFVAGEGATVTETSGTYSSSDAGTRTVTADLDAGDFNPNSNTLMSNYIIPSPVTGVGTITRTTICCFVIDASITGNPTKTYDGTTVATLTPTDYTMNGFVDGEGATITQTVGVYGDKNAGQQSVTAQLAPTDYTADPGTNLDNYTLPTEATGIGTILRAPLTASIIGNPTKTYNGSTNAILLSANFSFGGFVAGEGASLPAGPGNYDVKNVGSRVIVKPLNPSAFTANAGTLLSNYTLPTLAIGPGTINPAPLTILNVSAVSKVYDTTTVAQLAGTGSLFGLVAGETVGLSSAGATGTFASKNVGNGIAVSTAGFTLTGPDLANYSLIQPQGLTANITAKSVQILNVVAPDKVYDATTTATLNLSTAALDGVFAGETVGFNSAGASGAFLQSHVGSNLPVTTGGFVLTGADAGNYALSQPSYVTASITPRPLSGAIIGNPTKVYDATTQAFLTAANYSVSGFVAGQSATITQAASSAYDSADAGVRTLTATVVVSDFQAAVGTDLSNYALPSSLTGPGTISRVTLAAAVINNPTKVYDANQAASLTSANYRLSGFVGGQGATITQTSGLYASRNVGTRSVSALLSGADFVPDGSTNLNNYNLPSIALGSGTITPANVTVIDVFALDKVYDATTVASLDNSAADLSGVLGGDVVTVASMGASGTFATKNVGTNVTVTATGYALGGGDAGNYTVIQPTGLSADITQATIALASVTKVYDASTTAPTADSAYTLAGVFGGDVVLVSAAGITGNYDNKNVGTGKLVTLAGVTTAGADAGNYVIAPTTTNAPIGVITPAQLTVTGAVALDKVYDQTTAATIDNTGTLLAGKLGTDDVTLVTTASGQFNDRNVGVNKPVTTTGYSVTGVDAGNYTLAQPGYLVADITPLEIFLTSVSKVYGGNTNLPTDAAGYGFTGVIGGDAVTASPGGATGAYADKNVAGSLAGGVVTGGINVSVAGLGLSGTDAGNYFVSDVVNQPIGVITPQTLTAAIIGNPTKVYDTTIAASLTTANYQLTGFVAGEGADVTETVGLYDSKNAGARTVTAALGGGDFTPINGATLLTNYTLPASASGAGQITQAQLTVAGAAANDKVYDGNTNATLDNTGTSLVGALGVDMVNLANAATGLFADANVGTAKPVTTTGYAVSGTDAANYVLQQPNYLTADITQALLNLIKVTRVYTALTPLPTVNSAYTLSGVVSGDDVGVDASGILGNYAAKNVGTNINVTFTGLALNGTDAVNYSIASSLTNAAIGEITPATVSLAGVLANTKIYDGTTALTLNNTGTTVIGALQTDDLGVNSAGSSAAFGSPNVGTYSVTASGYLLTGVDAGNYLLTQPSGISATINPKALAASIVNTPTKTYDGATSATLISSNYALSGFIGAEGATVTETVGTYDSKNAGARTVTATLDAGDFTAGGGTLLSNYVLPTTASGAGQINQKALNAAIIGNPTKTYDATTAALLASANYQLTGFVAGESASVTETAGLYDIANAGPRTVSATLDAADFTAAGATLLSNYVLPTTASGAGTINQAALTATIINNPTKTYDATTGATLISTNYQLTGFVAGQGATVTETVGVYGSANAGPRTVSATLDGGDFTAGGATLLANYVLPTTASGAGTISQANLLAAIIGNPAKTYDATNVAHLTSANYSLVGFVGSEGASVTQTSGVYADVNAGARAVTASLATSNFTANGGTLLSNYNLPTTAAGVGTINQAVLTAAIIGLPTKTYDATTAAILAASNYGLTGFVAGESASVTKTTGAYASPNAGIRTVSTTLAGGDFTAGSSTLLSNYVLPTTASGAGIINRAPLTASIIGDPTKTYDGNTVAALTSANYAFSGFIAGQSGTITRTTGVYDSANAGARTVTATFGSSDFTAGGGTLLTNYLLPTSASGAGRITQAALTAAIIGNPTKPYDGTTSATLSSGNYQLLGFVAGEGADVTETAGTYASPNVGPRVVTASLGSSDFTATGATLLSNYVLPTTAAGIGQINQAQLVATLINVSKTYDGTTGAVLASGNYVLTGFAAGEGAGVTETVGVYGSANAGPRTVTASLDGADFTATGSTQLSNYTLPTVASGIGRIDQKGLAALITGFPIKIYDGSPTATLTSTDYALTGFIAGESASVSQTVGAYASPNAGPRVVTANLTSADFAAGASTQLSNYVLPTQAVGAGRIDTKTLTAALVGVSKTYDATTNALLDPSDYVLSGFVSGEGAVVTETAGTYVSPNAGARVVTASLDSGDFTATGPTLLSNYTLPTTALGVGQIDPAQLIATLTGVSKTYDGNTDAALAQGNYTLTGFAAGEGADITKTVGVYGSPNAGLRTVTTNLDSADFTVTGSTQLSNYVLPTTASGIGRIDQRTLAVLIIGLPARPYNGTTTATLTSSDYTVTGFIAGEGAGARIIQTVGTYGSPNVGVHAVTVDLVSTGYQIDDATQLSNYALPTQAIGVGRIDQRTLTASLVGVSKTYDGTTSSLLDPSHYVLSGFVFGEGADVTETVGTYTSPNAGSHIVTANLDGGDFAATGSTLMTNYTLPAIALGTGVIDPAALAATIIGNPTRIYDATTAAALTSANYQLTGFIGGEGGGITQTNGTYDSANAGRRIVTAGLAIGDFTVTGSTLLTNYTLPTTASGAGQIDQASLTAAIINNPTRTYDATTAAALTSVNYQLTGFIGGEGATVTKAVGAYDSANAGPRTVTTSLGGGDFTATGATLLSNYVLPTTAAGAGTINRAVLTAAIIGNPTKTEDGTTVATLTSADYSLVGFVGGEGASITQTVGAYSSPEVGVHPVTASLTAADYLAGGGTLLTNYDLPTSATGNGTITASRIVPTCITLANCKPIIDIDPTFVHTIGNPRFYVPFPVLDPIYLGGGNGLAGLPSILWAPETSVDGDGLVVDTGPPVVNSLGQILRQGGKAKRWSITFPPRASLDTFEAQP
jgi:filamentous hemagglutinin family protein